MTSAAIPNSLAPSSSLRRRVTIGVLVSIVCAVYVLWFDQITHQTGPGGSDFDQLWYGARVLWRGGNPYAEIGPGKAFDWGWPLVYPLPTIVAFLPFAALPLLAARLIFSSVSAGLLAFAVSKRGLAPLTIMLSAAVLDALRAGQLSMLMTSALLLTALSFTFVLKPPFGLALLAANPRPRAMLIAAGAATVLIAASFAAQPHWVSNWVGALAGASHVRIPLFTLGGPLLLLAVLRWRRMDARVLLACACVPHTPVVYDVVPLGLLVRSTREGIGFAVLTYAAMLTQDALIAGLAPGDAATRAARLLNVFVYLPALLLVLSRPNERDAP
jgi:hypothetical protein